MTRTKQGAVPPVDKQVQETSICRYRGAKLWDIYTTNNSDICLLKRRGWEPVTGKEAEQALPYLIFRIPANKLTIRSKAKSRKKVAK